jgi:hypothetical protein
MSEDTDNNNIWVVSGSTGCYSDRIEWIVCAFTNETEAREFENLCQVEADKFEYDCSRCDYGHKYDQRFKLDYTGTSYYTEMVELR